MRNVLISLILAASPNVFAKNELDQPDIFPSDQELIKAQDLPQTVVIRFSEKDPNDYAVAFVREPVAEGAKVPDVPFEKVKDLDQEINGKAFGSKGELDRSTSTESWGFRMGGWGWRRGWYGGWGWRRGWWGPRVGIGFAVGGGYWAPPYGCNPGFAYGGYTYPYYPYWGYRSGANVNVFFRGRWGWGRRW